MDADASLFQLSPKHAQYYFAKDAGAPNLYASQTDPLHFGEKEFEILFNPLRARSNATRPVFLKDGIPLFIASRNNELLNRFLFLFFFLYFFNTYRLLLFLF